MFKETNTELPFLYMNDNWLLCKNKACFVLTCYSNQRSGQI